MISLLATVLVAALIVWLTVWALGQIPLPQPARTVLVVVLIFVVWLAQRFGLL